MDDFDSIKNIFFEECDELLSELEQNLEIIKDGGATEEIINAAFRSVHSVKGGAGSFGMPDLVRFAHVFETAFDLLRSRKIDADSHVIKIFLRATDVLSDSVRAEREGLAQPLEKQDQSIKELNSLDCDDSLKKNTTQNRNDDAEETDEERGNAPLFSPVSMELSEIDNVIGDEFDVGFEIFEAIEDNSSCEESEKSKNFSEVSLDNKIGNVKAEGAATALKVNSQNNSVTIRVDLERIDKLVDLVGELVIGQATLREKYEKNHREGTEPVSIENALGDIDQLTRNIQDAVMAVRAQPLRTVFQRMQRVVREAAHATGKSIQLTMEGEDTEIDRSLIERLTDPLTHMLRNAVDHGIESAEDRLKNGKSAEGAIRLSASQKSGRIIITVADDGGGINRERVRSIAVEKGIINSQANLSENEIDNLIFFPGFSTSSTVSDLSGRGVGMDVVKRAILDVGGRVAIFSKKSVGSTFLLSLPLTLAVIEGMAITSCGQTFILPVSCIVETMLFNCEDVFLMGDGIPALSIRGVFMPLLDIGVVLGFSVGENVQGREVILVVEDDDGNRVALLADGIDGQMQVVSKNVEKNFRATRGISAATILGNGNVALVLDTSSIIHIGSENMCKLPYPNEFANVVQRSSEWTT
ncbi:chemotaxis protein CheA [Acetobacter sacchari]|uniref:Chemotaxis protein CheA n=1 Tax=Acetobacter sacchari TaxID=2661687 RepID=A0ABS3LY44_9PROT|nr:chemotaxis protein CheA [Acetobacter sacchari]MBO1360803.1 chemotaxis protein CheA [Acetobacter sacchari]